jgi:hypothetical protein
VYFKEFWRLWTKRVLFLVFFPFTLAGQINRRMILFVENIIIIRLAILAVYSIIVTRAFGHFFFCFGEQNHHTDRTIRLAFFKENPPCNPQSYCRRFWTKNYIFVFFPFCSKGRTELICRQHVKRACRSAIKCFSNECWHFWTKNTFFCFFFLLLWRTKRTDGQSSFVDSMLMRLAILKEDPLCMRQRVA